jgi:hypothetical protein
MALRKINHELVYHTFSSKDSPSAMTHAESEVTMASALISCLHQAQG